MKLTDLELGWLAGLLEGEGCFIIRTEQRKGHGYSKHCCVELAMTDEDTIYKAAHTIGKLTGHHHEVRFRHQKANWNSSCSIAVHGPDAKKVMLAIVKLMSARRRKKIWQCLNGHYEAKPEPKSNKQIDISELIIPQTPNVIKIARRF